MILRQELRDLTFARTVQGRISDSLPRLLPSRAEEMELELFQGRQIPGLSPTIPPPVNSKSSSGSVACIGCVIPMNEGSASYLQLVAFPQSCIGRLSYDDFVSRLWNGMKTGEIKYP